MVPRVVTNVLTKNFRPWQKFWLLLQLHSSFSCWDILVWKKSHAECPFENLTFIFQFWPCWISCQLCPPKLLKMRLKSVAISSKFHCYMWLLFWCLFLTFFVSFRPPNRTPQKRRSAPFSLLETGLGPTLGVVLSKTVFWKLFPTFLHSSARFFFTFWPFAPESTFLN